MAAWTVWGGTTTPWLAMGVLGLAGLLLVLGIVQRRTKTRVILGGLMAAVSALTWVAIVGLMAFPAYEGLAVGAPVPAFAAATATGLTVDAATLQGEATLVVFYRGRW